MSNALKFTFKGSIEITLEADLPHENLLKITIKDTGIGIPQSVLPKLFKLYNTFDSA